MQFDVFNVLKYLDVYVIVLEKLGIMIFLNLTFNKRARALNSSFKETVSS